MGIIIKFGDVRVREEAPKQSETTKSVQNQHASIVLQERLTSEPTKNTKGAANTV